MEHIPTLIVVVYTACSDIYRTTLVYISKLSRFLRLFTDVRVSDKDYARLEGARADNDYGWGSFEPERVVREDTILPKISFTSG